VRVVWILQERTGQRVHQLKSKFAVSLSHLVETVDKGLHPLSEFRITIDKRVDFAHMVLYLLEQALNCSIDTSQSTMLQLQFNLRNTDIAGLALEEISLEIIFFLDVQGYHEGLVSDLPAVFGISCVVTTVVTSETQDDDISEVGDACAAGVHFTREEAHLARHLETHRLVLHQLILLKRLRKVVFVSHSLQLSILLILELLLCVLNAVSHLLELLQSSPEIAHLHLLVEARSEGVFDVRVARRVSHLDRQGELLALRVMFNLFQKESYLGVLFGLSLLPLLLASTEILVGAFKESFQVGDFSFF
jgi:hypothetical protein